MEIIIIAAMAENRTIGKNNALPWSLKEDLARFKELTTGWPCVMGRRTWESLPKKPLPGRLNVIVTRTLNEADLADTNAGAVRLAPSLQDAVQLCAAYQKVFICGGESIYREALPLANRIELTVVHKNYEGDAFFPEIDMSTWTKTDIKDFDSFSFIGYSRK